MDIPVSDFTGCIKQVPSDGLTEEGLVFLNTHFPGFFEEESLAKALQARGIAHVISSTGSRATGTGRLRRYSGGASLQRQRYFTLCERDDGYDGGTLLGELHAYSDRRPGKCIALLDSTQSSATRAVIEQHIGAALPYRHALAVMVFPADDAGNPNGPAEIGLYRLNVFQAQIGGMLDLRYRHVQDWFHATFAELENQQGAVGVGPLRTLKRRVASFRDMLPTLVCQDRGGAMFHDAVGHWLRSQGVSALAFPSARADASVRSNAHTVESHTGWNMLIYDGASSVQQAPGDVVFGHMGGWYREHEAGIKALHWTDDAGVREWRITR